MGNYLDYLVWLSPEVVVIITALVVMVSDLVADVPLRKQLVYTSLLGLAAALVLNRAFIAEMPATPDVASAVAQGMPPLLYFAPFTAFLKDAVLIATALTIVLYSQQKDVGNVNLGEFLSLILCCAAGLMFLVSSDDLLMVFLSMEFVGIVSYVLVGYIRDDRKAGEGAVKFYLIGAFSSAIMVYGMSFIFGLAGTTSISMLGNLVASGQLQSTLLLKSSVLLLMVGLGFKLAMVPFHSWLPDAMEGAPSAVSGFISVAPKAAGLAIVIRIFGEAFPLTHLQMVGTLTVLAIATMTLGNLMALPQTNIKRLLAYSSIGHIGYIMVGVIAANELGISGVMVYVVAYLFMNLGAFACVIAVSNRLGSSEIEDFAGLSRRCLPIALVFAVFLFSLCGLPPTAGFIGKLLVFAGAVKKSCSQAGVNPLATPYLWLVIVGVLNSVISVYYYMRVTYQMFFAEPKDDTGVDGSGLLWLGTGIADAMILIIGIFPNSLIAAAQAAAEKLVLH